MKQKVNWNQHKGSGITWELKKKQWDKHQAHGLRITLGNRGAGLLSIWLKMQAHDFQCSNATANI